jgi:hypothetical protein
MALVLRDRVKETTTTTGTGTINLAGTSTGFRTFVAAVGNGNQTYYVLEDGVDWEVGIGTVTDGTPDTLSRSTILASSNSGLAVNWGAGTRNVFASVAAAAMLLSANNLSELTSASTARTNLGLGSAAVLTAGTAANNAVQLNGSAQLPAVSGVNLTNLNASNLASGTVPMARIAQGAGSTLDADLLDGQQGTYYKDVPATTVMLFFQATAPTGWTQVTSQNDKVLRVVSTAGGGTGGSWTISGLSTDAQPSNLPAHVHTLPTRGGASGSDFNVVYDDGAGPPIGLMDSNSAGSGGNHSHNVSADGAWRPSYINVITCSRNA